MPEILPMLTISRGRPIQNWTPFLRNHLAETAAIEFLTVPTVTFRTLSVFVVLSLDRRCN